MNKYTLMSQQRTAVRKSHQKPAFAYFMDMGTGKTLAAIVDMERYDLDIILVICPKSVMDVWDNEINKYAQHAPANVWTNKKKARLDNHPDRKWWVMNIEALSDISKRKYLEKKLRNKRYGVILDESHYIKGHTKKRSKNTTVIGAKAEYRRLLTGTPITRNIGDLYSQFRFLAPRVFGTNFFAFRNKYILMGGYQREVIRGGRIIKVPTQIVGYQNMDDLKRRMKPYVYMCKKEDCMDLPPKVYQRRFVDLTPLQKRHYKEMKSALVSLFDEETVTARIVLTQLLRLQQITSGFVKTDLQNTKVFEPNPPKLQELCDIIDSTDQSIIIWTKFDEEVRMIQEAIIKNKLYTQDEIGVLVGKTKKKDREQHIKDFQAKKRKIMISNTAVGGVGITLTAATLVVYYSNSFNFADRAQSEDRAHRKGQKNKVTYIDLIYKSTIDEYVLKTLKNKSDLSDDIWALKEIL